jgi:hypothetical protein
VLNPALPGEFNAAPTGVQLPLGVVIVTPNNEDERFQAVYPLPMKEFVSPD